MALLVGVDCFVMGFSRHYRRLPCHFRVGGNPGLVKTNKALHVYWTPNQVRDDKREVGQAKLP